MESSVVLGLKRDRVMGEGEADTPKSKLGTCCCYTSLHVTMQVVQGVLGSKEQDMRTLVAWVLN